LRCAAGATWGQDESDVLVALNGIEGELLVGALQFKHWLKQGGVTNGCKEKARTKTPTYHNGVHDTA
jgi:hypothetical protein